MLIPRCSCRFRVGGQLVGEVLAFGICVASKRQITAAENTLWASASQSCDSHTCRVAELAMSCVFRAWATNTAAAAAARERLTRTLNTHTHTPSHIPDSMNRGAVIANVYGCAICNMRMYISRLSFFGGKIRRVPVLRRITEGPGGPRHAGRRAQELRSW